MDMFSTNNGGIVSLFYPHISHLKETYNPRKVDRYIQRVQRITDRMLPGAQFNASPFGGMGLGATLPYDTVGTEPGIALEPGASPTDLLGGGMPYGPGTASPYGGAGNPIPGAIYGLSPFAGGAMSQGIAGLGPMVL